MNRKTTKLGERHCFCDGKEQCLYHRELPLWYRVMFCPHKEHIGICVGAVMLSRSKSEKKAEMMRTIVGALELNGHVFVSEKRMET